MPNFTSSGTWIVNGRKKSSVNETLNTGMSIAGDSANQDPGLIANYLDHDYEFTANASFTVEELPYKYTDDQGVVHEGTAFAMNLDRGRVSIKHPNLVGTKAQTYYFWPFIVRVKTNNASTGTKGTEYWVEAVSSKTYIGVLDGEVEVIELDTSGGWVAKVTLTKYSPVHIVSNVVPIFDSPS